MSLSDRKINYGGKGYFGKDVFFDSIFSFRRRLCIGWKELLSRISF
jgi:hypothetical protein